MKKLISGKRVVGLLVFVLIMITISLVPRVILHENYHPGSMSLNRYAQHPKIYGRSGEGSITTDFGIGHPALDLPLAVGPNCEKLYVDHEGNLIVGNKMYPANYEFDSDPHFKFFLLKNGQKEYVDLTLNVDEKGYPDDLLEILDFLTKKTERNGFWQVPQWSDCQ